MSINPDLQNWSKARSDYEAKRARSDAMPLGTPGEDEAVDAYCRAMDFLIDQVPAPDVAAISYKLELISQRYEDPGDGVMIPRRSWVSVCADVSRLSQGAANA